MKRYEKFADDIAELIRSGVLGPGQRVPSVRYASQTYGVSPSTVFQAYYLLERRGLIRAKPRSGYFVNTHTPGAFCEPVFSSHVTESTQVDVSALVFSVLDSIKDPHTVPFGSAFPSPMLFPLQRLARSMATASREMDPRMVVTDMSPGNPQLRRVTPLRHILAQQLIAHTFERGALEHFAFSQPRLLEAFHQVIGGDGLVAFNVDTGDGRPLDYGYHQDVAVAAQLDVLKVINADFAARDMRCQGQHWHTAAMGVEQAVDQMQVAGAATAGAHGQLAG